ncbi:MAG: EamA family transporter [Gemmatimonadota bacterium]
MLPPYLLGAARFTIAGAVMLAVATATGRRIPRDRSVIGHAVLVGILLLVLGNGFLNTAQQHLSTGLAALLLTTVPMWNTLIAMFGRQHERLAPIGWVGLVVGLAGVAILVKPFESIESSWFGVIVALLAAFTWSLGTVHARRRLAHVDALVASAIANGAAGPLMFGVHLVIERGQPAVWNQQAWISIVYLALVGSLIGFSAFAFIAAHMSSSKVGTYTYVNPVVAIILGWWVLDETLTWRLVLGGVTILAGLLLVYFSRVRAATWPPR